MPKVTVDLKMIKVSTTKSIFSKSTVTLIIFKDLLNDERLPEELHLEYGNRFDKLWNKKSMTDEEKRNKVEESMIKKPDSELKDAITYDEDGFPTINGSNLKNENGGI